MDTPSYRQALRNAESLEPEPFPKPLEEVLVKIIENDNPALLMDCIRRNVIDVNQTYSEKHHLPIFHLAVVKYAHKCVEALVKASAGFKPMNNNDGNAKDEPLSAKKTDIEAAFSVTSLPNVNQEFQMWMGMNRYKGTPLQALVYTLHRWSKEELSKRSSRMLKTLQALLLHPDLHVNCASITPGHSLTGIFADLLMMNAIVFLEALLAHPNINKMIPMLALKIHIHNEIHMYSVLYWKPADWFHQVEVVFAACVDWKLDGTLELFRKIISLIMTQISIEVRRCFPADFGLEIGNVGAELHYHDAHKQHLALLERGFIRLYKKGLVTPKGSSPADQILMTMDDVQKEAARAHDPPVRAVVCEALVMSAVSSNSITLLKYFITRCREMVEEKEKRDNTCPKQTPAAILKTIV